LAGGGRYEDYDYACSYGDRLPAPSPVYGRHGYSQVRSSLGNPAQGGTVDWYARSDGDGHFEPERYHDNLQAPDGRSPYRQPYDESSLNRSRDVLGGYYDDGEGRYLDGKPAGSLVYAGTSPASRLTDAQSRRNGGIGYDWTTAALPTDRKSGYGDDSLLIIGESGEFYTTADDRPSPFDYNTGTIQRRAAAAGTKPSPYFDEPRSVDGMERRIPAAQLELNLNDVAKSRATSHRKLVPNCPKLDKPEAMSAKKLVSDSSVWRHPVKLALDLTDFSKRRASSKMNLVSDLPTRDKPEAERRLPVGTESISASESSYRKEKDRGALRDSPYRTGATTTTTTTTAATGKNGRQGQVQGRAKVVDDIQRLTERDRVPGSAAQNRKQQQQNHVTSREETVAKPSRSRGHKTMATTPVTITFG